MTRHLWVLGVLLVWMGGLGCKEKSQDSVEARASAPASTARVGADTSPAGDAGAETA